MLRTFAAERDWEQFHTPKNLIMALMGEVGELAELFQWLSPEQVASAIHEPQFVEKVRDEIADVVAYIFRLADVLGIDLSQATRAKIDKNAQKYPVEKAKGHARKYSEL
jgi:NTP pyrophosphatase (non-canonical NTP hydrolase)